MQHCQVLAILWLLAKVCVLLKHYSVADVIECGNGNHPCSYCNLQSGDYNHDGGELKLSDYISLTLYHQLLDFLIHLLILFRTFESRSEETNDVVIIMQLMIMTNILQALSHLLNDQPLLWFILQAMFHQLFYSNGQLTNLLKHFSLLCTSEKITLLGLILSDGIGHSMLITCTQTHPLRRHQLAYHIVD